MAAGAGAAFAAQAASQMVSGAIGGINAWIQSQYVGRQAEINARYLELAASEAEYQGDKQAKKLEEEGRKFIGAQRAAVAAQGISLDSDVAAELRHQSEDLIGEDAQTIRNNAWAQAFGYRSQAASVRDQAKVAQAGLRLQAATSLIGAGGKVAQTGVQYQRYQQLYGGGQGGSLAGGVS